MLTILVDNLLFHFIAHQYLNKDMFEIYVRILAYIINSLLFILIILIYI